MKKRSNFFDCPARETWSWLIFDVVERMDGVFSRESLPQAASSIFFALHECLVSSQANRMLIDHAAADFELRGMDHMFF